jgi:hypothetical protein
MRHGRRAEGSRGDDDPFVRSVAGVLPVERMRAAYADPPYIGMAERWYKEDPCCAEIDHAKLIAQLNEYDAWALSCSSTTLQWILALCPQDVRIGAYCKTFAPFRKGVNHSYVWEPVIFPAPLHAGCAGAKPEKFAVWVFLMLGLQPDDEFMDLFPGSGAIGRAWEMYRRQARMF